MKRAAMLLTVLGIASVSVLAGGCRTPPPSQSEMSSVDYGPRPDNHEKLIREYLSGRLVDPAGAIVEFKSGPKRLYQQDTTLRPLQYGWGVCVWINDKNPRGAYEGPYPMVFFIRNGKIVGANGGSDDNIVGWRYARTGCNELGTPFVQQ